MICVYRAQFRNRRIALRHAMRAARRESAARGKSIERRNRTGNRDQLFTRETWRCAQESFGVWVTRSAQNVRDGAFFHDASRIHDYDAIGDLRDNSKIVRDEKHRELQFAAQFCEEFDDLFLNGDVESGSGLVGDQHARTGRERHGDHHALAQAARKLMRILACAAGGISERGAFDGGEGAAADFVCASARLVDANCFLDLRSDAQDGIECGHRLLKNHGDFAAANFTHFLWS